MREGIVRDFERMTSLIRKTLIANNLPVDKVSLTIGVASQDDAYVADMDMRYDASPADVESFGAPGSNTITLYGVKVKFEGASAATFEAPSVKVTSFKGNSFDGKPPSAEGMNL